MTSNSNYVPMWILMFWILATIASLMAGLLGCFDIHTFRLYDSTGKHVQTVTHTSDSALVIRKGKHVAKYQFIDGRYVEVPVMGGIK